VEKIVEKVTVNLEKKTINNKMNRWVGEFIDQKDITFF